MGQPPSNGGHAFRFTPNEVVEMEAILHEHGIQIPSQDLIVALSEKFSQSTERTGKMNVQVKQVWNWFQNRRFVVRSKIPLPLSKSTHESLASALKSLRKSLYFDTESGVKSVISLDASQSGNGPCIEGIGLATSTTSLIEFNALSKSRTSIPMHALSRFFQMLMSHSSSSELPTPSIHSGNVIVYALGTSLI